MKIAILGPLKDMNINNVLGGTEVFNINLFKGLKNKGHEVTIYKTLDSQNSRLLTKYLENEFISYHEAFPSSFTRQSIIFRLINFARFIADQSKYDLVHISTTEWYALVPFIHLLKIPYIITVHSKLIPNKALEILFSNYPNLNLVFVSESFKNSFPVYPKTRVIYNGTNTKNFSQNSGDYVAWLGRINLSKGIKEAIEICKKKR